MSGRAPTDRDREVEPLFAALDAARAPRRRGPPIGVRVAIAVAVAAALLALVLNQAY